MKYIPKGRARPAFTLVEILMVIAIIGILIALILPALTKALGIGARATARSEIAQLETGLAAARQGLAPDNPALVLPSSIILAENIGDYTSPSAPAGAPASLSFLTKVFGKRAMVSTNKIDWNGDLSIDPAGTFKTLTGNQALVFWLGGIPSGVAAGTPSCLGFSNNITNPAAVGGTRKGPYYEFKNNRLVASTQPTSQGFLSYQDSFGTGQVYVYFTSYTKGNDYSSTDGGGNPATPTGPLPYMSNTSTFVNPNGIQILCAGKDGQWGAPFNTISGSTTLNWTPSNGYTLGPADPGYDDLGNFSSSTLGNGITN